MYLAQNLLYNIFNRVSKDPSFGHVKVALGKWGTISFTFTLAKFQISRSLLILQKVFFIRGFITKAQGGVTNG